MRRQKSHGLINFGQTLKDPDPVEKPKFQSQTKLYQRDFITHEEESNAYEKLCQTLQQIETENEDIKIKMIDNDDYTLEGAFELLAGSKVEEPREG